jgi:hypothetical protein
MTISLSMAATQTVSGGTAVVTATPQPGLTPWGYSAIMAILPQFGGIALPVAVGTGLDLVNPQTLYLYFWMGPGTYTVFARYVSGSGTQDSAPVVVTVS